MLASSVKAALSSPAHKRVTPIVSLPRVMATQAHHREPWTYAENPTRRNSRHRDPR